MTTTDQATTSALPKTCTRAADPFLWVTALYEMKNVISICNFYRDQTFQCNDTAATMNEMRPMSDEPSTDGIAASEEFGPLENTQSAPSLNFTIDKLENGIAVISVSCNMTRSAKHSAIDPPELTETNRKQWSYGDGMYNMVKRAPAKL